MCDTVVKFSDKGIFFAKNSDRDPNEAQITEWHPAAQHQPGAKLKASWIEIDQVAATNSIIISRPWWMWGAEMGANEHGVVIGNEAVFTKQSLGGEPGLLGMDLLRLALERAASAAEAVQIMVSLLERHGQVGSCSHDNPGFRYHNSFLVADPNQAFVLETAGRFSAVEEVRSGVRAISNGLTIPGFAEQHSDRLKSWVSQCRVRRGVSERVAGEGAGLEQMMRVLRDNGTGAGPAWSILNGSMRGPNMHAGGLGTSSQTVSSWVSQLNGLEHQHWVTGTADAALSVFFPARFDEPQSFVQASNRFDAASWWWQGELLHRLALHDWEEAEGLIAQSRDALQRKLLAEQPSTETALAVISAQRDDWLKLLTDANLAETRPWWVRRLWRGWNRAAGFTDPQQTLVEAAA